MHHWNYWNYRSTDLNFRLIWVNGLFRTQRREMRPCIIELELELIQTQMAQKPMLRAEVYAHAMRASQNRKKEVHYSIR